jgi:hypothetical protein
MAHDQAEAQIQHGKCARRTSWPKGRWYCRRGDHYETSKLLDDGGSAWLPGRALWPVDETAADWIAS